MTLTLDFQGHILKICIGIGGSIERKGSESVECWVHLCISDLEMWP